MPAQQRLRTRGLQQGEYVTRRLGREARDLRLAAGLGQRHLARALGVSRQWLGDFELARLPSVDLRRVTVLFALLGHKLVASAYPTGEPMRDAGQLRLLERFNRRVAPTWHRVSEAVMPHPGDLRAWDQLLRGPVTIGVEAETRPTDLQALVRTIAGKRRDSGVERVVLLVAGTARNRAIVRAHVAILRQTFPLDTRTTLAAVGEGRDPGADGLVLL
jgi:hypothetical protein